KLTPLFDRLYQKYFIDRRKYLERVTSEYLTSTTGKLSEYDALLKQYAGELNWDWRLLASQTYQESRFRPAARSWAGAAGLLQISTQQYSTDAVVKFGFCRGLEPVNYVTGILERFDHYKQFVVNT